VTKAEVMVEEDEDNAEASEAVNNSRDRTSENEAFMSRNQITFGSLRKQEVALPTEKKRRTECLFLHQRSATKVGGGSGTSHHSEAQRVEVMGPGCHLVLRWFS